MKKIAFLLVLLYAVICFVGCSQTDIEEPIVPDEGEFIYAQQSVVNIKKNSKYADFFNGEGEFYVPGLKDGFIPQSVDVNDDKFYVSGYFNNLKQSVIFVIDGKTKKRVKELFIQDITGAEYNGHLGGIAVNSNHMFLTLDDSKIGTISMSTINDASFSDTVKIEREITTPVKTSYCNYSNGYLYVGEFELEKEKFTTSPEHKTNGFRGWTAAYLVNIDGSIVLDKIISVPEKVQGFTDTGTEYAISVSYGRTKTSYIRFFKKTANVGAVIVDGMAIPLYELSSQTREYVCPPMTEGITYRSGSVYVVFESATNKYYFDANIFHRAICPVDMVWKLVG